MIRFFRPPIFLKLIYGKALYRLPTMGERKMVLTFDDGPHPDSTPAILDILSAHDIQSVFFCSGRAIQEYPDIASRMVLEGHQIGNHGYNHVNGWSVGVNEYIADVAKAAGVISSPFFRPPYGRLTPAQFRLLRMDYTIVFWDLMAYDFDRDFGTDGVKNIILRKARPGTILVMHDSPGSLALAILDDIIVSMKEEGYGFTVLPVPEPAIGYES